SIPRTHKQPSSEIVLPNILLKNILLKTSHIGYKDQTTDTYVKVDLKKGIVDAIGWNVSDQLIIGKVKLSEPIIQLDQKEVAQKNSEASLIDSTRDLGVGHIGLQQLFVEQAVLKVRKPQLSIN